jgi:hypothetical protein
VGRAKTTDGAIAWIKTMMANMDAEELATVNRKDFIIILVKLWNVTFLALQNVV